MSAPSEIFSTQQTESGNYDGNGSRNDHTESIKRYVIVCELLNIAMLCSTIWIIICMVIYGRCTRKWDNRKKNKIFIACFISIVFSLPDSIVVLVVINLPDSATHYQCSVAMNVASVTAAIGLLGTYIFLWLRQRAIYSSHYMKALHGRRVYAISRILLVSVVIALVGVTCSSLFEQCVTSSDHGCIKKQHESGNSTVPWDILGVLELCTTVISQTGFLLLFLYPMLRNRNVMKKISFAQTSGRGNIGRIIKRCTICAFIVIVSDVCIEIWVQFLPNDYPVMIIATVNQVDIFVDVVCIFAMFENSTKMLIVPCRQKETISRFESTVGRNSNNQYSDRSMKLLNNDTKSTKIRYEPKQTKKCATIKTTVQA